MRDRRLAQLATALASGVMTIALLSLPAAADTENAEVTSGTLLLKDEFDNPIADPIDLGDTSNCVQNPPESTVTMRGNLYGGSWDADLNSITSVQIGAVPFVAELHADFAGTYFSSDLTGTGSVYSTLQRAIRIGNFVFPCLPDPNYGPCEVSALNVSVSGTHTVAAPPDIVPGDAAIVSGGNIPGFFDVQVSGGSVDCGALIALNNGGVSLTDAVITATL